jgi:glycosyltransferase involved in cell wall biosynthesis
LTKRSTAFNGKFLASAPTGVHRVARELITSFDQLLGQQGAPAPEDTWQLLKPRDAYQPLSLAHIPARTVGINTWQPWEQLDLPLAARGKILVNLCNLGPLAHPRNVTMIHDAQVFSSPASYSATFRSWYQFALPWLGRHSMRVLTVSEFSRDQLVAYGIAERENIAVIYNGVDHLLRIKASSNALETLGLQPHGYVIGLASTQVHKNLKVLLEAFRDPRLSRLRLVLVGAAQEKAFVDAGLSLPANICFAGSVSDADFRGLMEAAICFACPSTTEGFGLPPLEAMTVGCPTIVAPRGALPEVCGDAALYADPDDPEAWVEAIVRLHEDRQCQEGMAARGISQAGQFTWARSARLLHDELSALQS